MVLENFETYSLRVKYESNSFNSVNLDILVKPFLT